MTKYNANSSYIFECQLKTSGVKASSIEKQFKSFLTSIIKESNPPFVSLSNECIDTKERTIKIYQLLEELEFLKHGEIVHFGKIPPLWKNQLKKEMEEKEELDQKRIEAFDDCIIICVKKNNTLSAIIVDRKGIYSISKNPPE